MIQFELYVPLLDNNGKTHPAVHDAVRKALLKKFGGFTRYKTRGGYVGENSVYMFEPVNVYRIFADDSSRGRLRFAEDTMQAIGRYVKDSMKQESVLITRQTVSTTFLD